MSDLDNQLRRVLGRVAYGLIKPVLQRIKIKIDSERREVHITKDQVTHTVTFDQIEQVINEQV